MARDRSLANAADTRQQIIDAALDIIVSAGAAQATARRIAEAAGVSPGTITYHFTSINDILAQAFAKMSADIATAFTARLKAAPDLAAARETVVDLIYGAVSPLSKQMMFSFELYTFVSRNPEYRGLAEEWMERSRIALQLHFDLPTAKAVDALLEGFTIHNFLNRQHVSRDDVLRAVSALTR